MLHAALLAAAAVAATPVPADPKPLFLDDFAKGNLAARYDFGASRWPDAPQSRTLAAATEERELYTSGNYLGLGIEACQVAGGVLSMNARPLPAAAQARYAAAVDGAIARHQVDATRGARMKAVDHSSCMLVSKARVPAIGTYFEFAAKLPQGKGDWTGLWAYDDDLHVEIDVAETAPGWTRPGCYNFSLHTPHEPVSTTSVCPGAGDLSTGFHRYGARLEGQVAIAYFDGREVARIPASAAFAKGRMALLVSLAEGAKGVPVNPDHSATMQVDSMSAWKVR